MSYECVDLWISTYETFRITVCLWQISLAELQSIVSELKARLEGQTANVESLTSTLKTKEEIITVSVNTVMELLNILECNRRFPEEKISLIFSIEKLFPTYHEVILQYIFFIWFCGVVLCRSCTRVCLREGPADCLWPGIKPPNWVRVNTACLPSLREKEP